MTPATRLLRFLPLLIASIILVPAPAEARLFEFKKYGCCITIPDNGWLITTPSNPATKDVYLQLVNVVDRKAINALTLAVKEFDTEFNEDLYGPELLRSVAAVVRNEGGVVIDSALITFNGHKAVRVLLNASQPGATEVDTLVMIAMPKRWYSYLIIFNQDFSSPERVTEIQEMLESFQFCGEPEKPEGIKDLPASYTPSARKGGEDVAFEMGRTLGPVLVIGAIIAAVVLGIRMYRKKQQEKLANDDSDMEG